MLASVADTLAHPWFIETSCPAILRCRSWTSMPHLSSTPSPFKPQDTRIARGDGGSVFVLVKESGSASTARDGYSNTAAAGGNNNGNGGGGAWKDDPLRNRAPAAPAAPANPAGSGGYPAGVGPAPATPLAKQAPPPPATPVAPPPATPLAKQAPPRLATPAVPPPTTPAALPPSVTSVPPPPATTAPPPVTPVPPLPAASVPPPVTLPAMNVDAQIEGGGDIESY